MNLLFLMMHQVLPDSAGIAFGAMVAKFKTLGTLDIMRILNCMIVGYVQCIRIRRGSFGGLKTEAHVTKFKIPQYVFSLGYTCSPNEEVQGDEG